MEPPFLLLFFVLCAILGVTAYTPLSDDTLKNLPAGGADFDIKTGSILAPILVPRVPGTPGNLAVQQHLVNWFKTNLPKWTIDFQNSTSTTPATGTKQVPFTNIILTRDPPWTKVGDVGRLALVAHFDSKLAPTGFIGATDSAAPCAMIMHAARSVDEALTKKWDAMQAEGISENKEEKGLQIILLDGEEAFVSWTSTDSLYGSRSLAAEWEATPHAAMSTYHSALSSIALFLLLDLLGASDPRVPSYFKTTHWAYQNLAKIESRLRGLSVQKSSAKNPFLPDATKKPDQFRQAYGVEDDHIPFMARGVEVLHIIPAPFPKVWHTMDDDGEHLDMDTVEDWTRMVTAFVGEWMDLEGYFPAPTGQAQKVKEKRKTELNET
ncbi:uncharacterized protein L3040_001109 [Drepanopeziza brunnea f. sp. 'multigermtubi']|uniref:uncharacterized protein n=1 Tax=Drepanopeziza brunnea f. sp. 'multigermtubi' TaxID=698441 RepID=UPI0023869D91|nr:hypothetical protein L3040_001109 [Drepanopeziza brunnea f. sp. 'multigermtubi']